MRGVGSAEASRGGDLAEGWTVDVGGAVGGGGLRELGMIQGVEEFQRGIPG